jgi:hypothetical protein
VSCGLCEENREFVKSANQFFKTTAIDHSAIAPQAHFMRIAAPHGGG